MTELLYLPEPALRFGHEQGIEDPRDGLTLFGPLDQGRPFGIRAGVLGTPRGIDYLKKWLRRIQGPLSDDGSQIARPSFPGFEAAFGVPWLPEPPLVVEVPEDELIRAVHLDDQHQRVYNTVDVYSRKILETFREEETAVDVWFVVIPDIVHLNCRPRSRIAPGLRVRVEHRFKPAAGRRLKTEPSFFREWNEAAEAYHYDVDFHHQLKARLLPHLVTTQIVRESTIGAPDEVVTSEKRRRSVARAQAAIAWNLSTAAFYKASGRPWKLDAIRDGVCYVGLVFKIDEKHDDPRVACCAAQMFLDSGDGMVFKGAVGPWYTPEQGEFHLSADAAKELVTLAVDSYKDRVGAHPKELFIHGKTWFSDDEWRGFTRAVDGSTQVVGIRIRTDDFRLYTPGTRPVLRGLAYLRSPRSAYLWTRGFAPRLQTYVGREVPSPLRVDIVRGNAEIETVLKDILALTKLNYNSCSFSDGLPVTLRFANAVGEILTAGPTGPNNPLPFKYYI